MERFGEKLRALREHRGLSYSQLAAALGYSRGHLSHIELGDTNPSPDLIIIIADFFSVSLDELMRDDRDVRLR
jgi:transcriptional regulator with XRE-family HTH domain